MHVIGSRLCSILLQRERNRTMQHCQSFEWRLPSLAIPHRGFRPRATLRLDLAARPRRLASFAASHVLLQLMCHLADGRKQGRH